MARARKFAAELANLAEVRARFKLAALAIDPAEKRRADFGISDALRTAAVYIRDKARGNAAGKQLPRRLYTGDKPAIFAFSDPDAGSSPRTKQSALIGVRTGLSARSRDPRLFIQWGRGARRRKDNSVATGGISMSFGALFERGTKDRRIRAGRYFRSAVFGTRAAVIQIMTNAYRKAVDRLNSIK